MSVVINIDGKTVAKGRGRVGTVNGHATVFTPAHTRKYEDRVKLAASLAMEGRDPIEGPVEIFINVYLDFPQSFSAKKREAAINGFLKPCTKPDIDNYVKSALDGINTIVIKDDNQVVSLHAHKSYRSKPALRIEVKEFYQPKSLEDML